MVASFFAAPAVAETADGAWWLPSIPDVSLSLGTAGATLRGVHGWTATLFVRRLGPKATDEDPTSLRRSTVVNGQFIHRLSKTSRISLDIFNVFDQRAGDADPFAASRAWSQPQLSEDYLFHPAEPRGFRVRYRKTF